MRKFLNTIVLTIIFILSFSVFGYAAEKSKTIVMQLNNTEITVDGINKNIDEEGTTPLIINDRAFIPVRSLIENIGGSAEWDDVTKTASLNYKDNEIRLTVNSNTAYFNGSSTTLDVVPVIVNGRTMLPVRFIAESFGFDVEWNSESRIITISSAVASSENSTEITTAVLENDPDKITNKQNNSKVLVAYFSCTGNTENVANKIAKAANADIYVIEPKQPYTDGDLDYNNNDCRANIEQNNSESRPEIANTVENMADYDIIYLGYPIWWGDCPRIINTFVEAYDFKGKRIIPFCTSGSSGIETSENTIKAAVTNANFEKGRRFDANVSDSIIEKWVKENEK